MIGETFFRRECGMTDITNMFQDNTCDSSTDFLMLPQVAAPVELQWAAGTEEYLFTDVELDVFVKGIFCGVKFFVTCAAQVVSFDEVPVLRRCDFRCQAMDCVFMSY